MITQIKSWWKHLGYHWGGGRDNMRTYGVRPWRGAPFFWLVVDTSNTARLKQSEAHRSTCEECEAAGEEP